MKTKLLFLFTVLCISMTLQLKAQTDSSLANTFQTKIKNEHPRNFIKVNLTALALKNYSIQYERPLNKKFSVAISFRTMPSTSLPFKNQILKSIEDDPDTKELIETGRLSNFAITPEIRWYVGRKGYGRGFYIAPFYRYASFKADHLILTYENDNSSEDDYNINLAGKLTANTGGLLFGAQWAIGRHICLDWSILGPHFGTGTGTFTGVSSRILTKDEQTNLQLDLEDLEIPGANKTVIVNANGALLKLDGPWAGVRAAISIGFKF